MNFNLGKRSRLRHKHALLFIRSLPQANSPIRFTSTKSLIIRVCSSNCTVNCSELYLSGLNKNSFILTLIWVNTTLPFSTCTYKLNHVYRASKKYVFFCYTVYSLNSMQSISETIVAFILLILLHSLTPHIVSTNTRIYTQKYRNT